MTMTLFEELGVEYKEVDGILYPLLSVDEAEYNLTDIGKYGRMWLRYMEENKPSGYHLWQSQDDNRTAPTEITNKNILQIRRCEWEIFHIQLM